MKRSGEQQQRLKAWTRLLEEVGGDSDWVDVLRVLEFQLGRLAQALEHGLHSDGRRRAAQVQAVRKLIDRVVANRYLDEAWAPYRKRWGDLELRDGKRTARATEMVFYFTKAKTSVEQRRADRRLAALASRAEKARQRDIERLFARMARDLQKWWE